MREIFFFEIKRKILLKIVIFFFSFFESKISTFEKGKEL